MTIAVILRNKGAEVATIDVGALVKDVVDMLAERRIGALPVVDGRDVVGIVSERDVIRALANGGAAALDRAVSTIMTAPAVTAAPEQSVLGALSLMTQRRIRHLPVVADGGIAGIVSIGDLVKHRIDGIEAEAAAMRDYIAG